MLFVIEGTFFSYSPSVSQVKDVPVLLRECSFISYRGGGSGGIKNFDPSQGGGGIKNSEKIKPLFSNKNYGRLRREGRERISVLRAKSL